MTNVIMETTYQETLEEIKKSFGYVPGFMNFIPKEKLASEWPGWKQVDEIYLERASCLLCTEGLSEKSL